MNRFIKDNLILVISIGLTAVVALALLIYGIIEWVHISDLMDQTEQLRNKISSIIKVKPAPVDGNKEPITKDTQEYVKLYKSLEPVFNSPTRAARNAFLKVLYNMKDTDDFDKKAQEFFEKYNERVRSDASMVEQRMAWEKMRLEFKNWDAAVDAFCKAAEQAGVSSVMVHDDFRDDAVLGEVNIPRRMGDNVSKLSDFLDIVGGHFKERLAGRMGDTKSTGEIANDKNYSIFGFVEDIKKLPVADYPVVARQTAILCDIIGRIANSKIATFNGLVIRGVTPESMGSSFTEENGCHLSHYTFEVTGSLDAIRSLASSFDCAIKDRRFYIVRSVSLNITDAQRKSLEENFIKREVSEEQPAAREENNSFFGANRRARVVQKKAQQADQLSDAQKSFAEAEAERIKKLDAEKPLHERSDYAQPAFTNATQFVATFDIDYIERR